MTALGGTLAPPKKDKQAGKAHGEAEKEEQEQEAAGAEEHGQSVADEGKEEAEQQEQEAAGAEVVEVDEDEGKEDTETKDASPSLKVGDKVNTQASTS